MLLICAQKKTTKRYLMAEKKQEEPTNSSKSLTDSETSDDTEVNPRLRTSVEEREYDTIPGSVIALSHSMAQANLTVEHGLLLQKAKIKKLPEDKAKDKATQTELKDKKSK